MARPRIPKAAAPGEPYKLRPVEKIKPLDPDKPLMPTRPPALKAFDKNVPGQLMLDQMGAIELPEGGQISEPQAAAQESLL